MTMPPLPSLFLHGVRVAALAWAVLPAAAAEPASPQGVVHLSASASIEVPRDLMTLVLSTSRDGADAAQVQTQLRQALDAALAEARKAARPGQLEVQTGGFSLHPRHGANAAILGWQGSAELILEGRDMPAIAQLAGRIGTMTIARVGYGLSRPLREKVEGDAAAQAIAGYRAKAAGYAKQFGYGGYVIREVNVNTDLPHMPPPGPMAMRSRAMSASADESLPVEAGKGLVTVNVSGSVQLTK